MRQKAIHCTHGPTDPSVVVAFTDGAQVQAFADAVCVLPASPATPA